MDKYAAAYRSHQIWVRMTTGRYKQMVAAFWKFKGQLDIVDNIVMYGDRVVIPPRLIKELLKHLHGAQQGVTQLNAIARIRAPKNSIWAPTKKFTCYLLFQLHV